MGWDKEIKINGMGQGDQVKGMGQVDQNKWDWRRRSS